MLCSHASLNYDVLVHAVAVILTTQTGSYFYHILQSSKHKYVNIKLYFLYQNQLILGKTSYLKMLFGNVSGLVFEPQHISLSALILIICIINTAQKFSNATKTLLHYYPYC